MGIQQSNRDYLLKTGIFFTGLCCFFLPFSTSLMGATAALATLFWLLSGNASTLLLLSRENLAVACALLLFCLLGVAIFYSPVPLADSLSTFKKYRELLFFVVAVSLLKVYPQATRYCERGFIAGAILLLVSSFAMYFSIIPVERYGYSTVYHITHSFFMAILAFWCLQKLFQKGWQRYLWLVLLLATTYNLFCIAPGRTGMLVFIVLVFLTLFQRLPLKISFLAAILATLAITGAYLLSTNFSTRADQAVHEIKNYTPGKSRTSLGMRFDWWHNSVSLMKENPLFGHGTGSFTKVQGDLIKGSATKPSDNPHNEYLLIGVQTGIIGLGLYLAMLGTLFYHSLQLPKSRAYLLQGVIVGMACGCIMNSFLHDSHPGHFFAFIAAVLYWNPGEEPNLAKK